MTQKPTPLERYRQLISSGVISPDADQSRVAEALERLFHSLDAKLYARKSSSLGWLLGAKKPQKVRGLYIHGAVGRGKTMLMDIFHDSVDFMPKRRVHFHAFMRDVQDRITAYRQDVKRGKVKDTDPIPPIGRQIAAESKLFCFDEFQVTDIADAMILGRLFETLFAQGVVVIATSNLPPEKLYQNGLNRQLFLPFIDMLKAEMDVLHLDSDRDYRHRALTRSDVYFTPLDDKAQKGMDGLWRSLTLSAEGEAEVISLMGRELHVPMAASGVARFPATALIDAPLGARDFLALTERYHTILIDDLPHLNKKGGNPQRRFVLLVDTAYDRSRALVISSEVAAEELVTDGPLAFEFERTVSRLTEMRSDEYLARVNLARGEGSADAAPQ